MTAAWSALCTATSAALLLPEQSVPSSAVKKSPSQESFTLHARHQAAAGLSLRAALLLLLCCFWPRPVVLLQQQLKGLPCSSRTCPLMMTGTALKRRMPPVGVPLLIALTTHS